MEFVFLEKNDEKLLQIEELINIKRKMLIDKQKKIKLISKQNLFLDEVKNDFPGMDWTVISESEVNLSEGIYHVGLGHVVRCVGRKHS